MPASRARRSRKSGSVMVLLTLMLPSLMIPLVGLAIDGSVARVVQLRLQAAVDGAAMGAGRLLGTPAVPETLAAEFLASNFRTDGSAGTWGAHDLTSRIVYTAGITKRIDIDATAQVPLLFLRILGKPNATVRAKGTGTRTDSRVMLIIDRSGSMLNGGVLDDAKTDAQTLFVDKFMEGADEVGLVVFNGDSYVAYPPVNPGWDPATTSTTPGGPGRLFKDPTNPNNMVHQIDAIEGGMYTGTADALWMAYIELQKAHLKDLAADGEDLRLNSIVFLTDGAPTAMSVWLNNPDDNVVASSTCTKKNSTAMADRMYGYVEGPPFGSLTGLRPLAYMNTARTSLQWGAFANEDGYFRTDSGLMNGCSSTIANNMSRIPKTDRWGNSTEGTNYKGGGSHFVNAAGNTITYAMDDNQIDTRLTFSLDHADSANYWAIAFWNVADDCARRIRTDAGRATRMPADTQDMRVMINVIGYCGSDGIDEGLLIRMANVKGSTFYDSSQPDGLYYRAVNRATLAAAFDKIVSAILRLAQ